MTGSAAPTYPGKDAYQHEPSEKVVRIDGYKNEANNASNTVPAFYSQDVPRNIARDAGKMSDPTREEIQAKIDASEARNDTKIARMEGKLDNLVTMIGVRFDAAEKEAARTRSEIAESRRFMVGTVIISALTMCGVIVSVIVAMALYGDTMFGRGMNAADLARAAAREAVDALKLPPSSPGK